MNNYTNTDTPISIETKKTTDKTKYTKNIIDTLDAHTIIEEARGPRLGTTQETQAHKTLRFGTFNAGGLNRKLGLVMRRIVELDLDWLFVTETQWEERNRDPPNSVSNARGRQEEWGRAHFGTMLLHHPDRKPVIEILRVGKEGSFQAWRWNGIFFIGVYWKPSTTAQETEELWQGIEEAMGLWDNSDPIILVGDFNTRLGNLSGDHATNNRARKLRGKLMLDDPFGMQLILPPAGPQGQHFTFRRFLDDGRIGTSIVDYIFAKYDGELQISAIADYDAQMSDHVLLHCAITDFTPRHPPARPPLPRLWKLGKLRDEAVREQMNHNFAIEHSPTLRRALDEFVITDQESCDALYEIFKEAIYRNADKVLGKRTKPVRLMPHVTDRLVEIAALIRDLNARVAALSRIGYPTSDLKAAIKELDDLQHELLVEGKTSIDDGYHRFVDQMDQSESHVLMMSMANVKKSRLRKKNNLLESTYEKLQEYNGFFFGQFGRPEGSVDWEPLALPLVQTSPEECTLIITTDKVKRVLKRLPNHKAAGMSGIRGEMMKHCADALAPYLSKLFTRMIAAGFVPSEWRRARIVPIPKKVRSALISDHRPISLTEVPRKCFERCIMEELVGVIEQLDIAQGGFRANRGTIEVIASYQETVLQFKRTHRRSPIVLFLDIKAAYDSVDHNILLTKLAERGCNPQLLRITEQLMCGIESVISVNGVDSPPLIHRAGVLQGAIISPALYSLYIDDLAEAVRAVIPGNQSVFMYADDVAIIVEREDQLEPLMRVLEAHSSRNNYRYNVRKCEILNSTADAILSGERMTHCTTFKYLGCMVDKDGINWDLHLDRLETKTREMLQFFRSVGYNQGGFRERTRITIFKTFLRPLWEYCLCIMPHLKRLLDRLNRLQHECLTAMFSVYRNTSQASLRALTGIPCVHHRYRELQARWFDRLGDKNEQHMVTVARNASRGRFLMRSSCFAQLGKNVIVDTMRRDGSDITDAILHHRRNHLTAQARRSRLTEKMTIDPKCKPRLLYSMSRAPRSIARTSTLWLLGKIPARPSGCAACGEQRVKGTHFADCIGERRIFDLTASGQWRAAHESIIRIQGHIIDPS